MIPLGNLISFQDYNGTVLAAGKLYVFNLGRNGLATVYGDVNGAVVLPNPVTLDNLGMSDIWLSPVFDYTLVVTDAYGAEMFSRDIYPQRPGSGETIGTQLYNGIDPIVVNNQTYTISANTSRLGVVTPLYFVKDDEEETIIGFSGQTVPEGVMSESALGFENNKITGYNGSAFSAGNEYEAGNYVDIDGNTINVTGLQPSGEYVTSGDLDEYTKRTDFNDAISSLNSSKLDVNVYSSQSALFLTALPADVAYTGWVENSIISATSALQPSGNFISFNDLRYIEV